MTRKSFKGIGHSSWYLCTVPSFLSLYHFLVWVSCPLSNSSINKMCAKRKLIAMERRKIRVCFSFRNTFLLPMKRIFVAVKSHLKTRARGKIIHLSEISGFAFFSSKPFFWCCCFLQRIGMAWQPFAGIWRPFLGTQIYKLCGRWLSLHTSVAHRELNGLRKWKCWGFLANFCLITGDFHE